MRINGTKNDFYQQPLTTFLIWDLFEKNSNSKKIPIQDNRTIQRMNERDLPCE